MADAAVIVAVPTAGRLERSCARRPRRRSPLSHPRPAGLPRSNRARAASKSPPAGIGNIHSCAAGRRRQGRCRGRLVGAGDEAVEGHGHVEHARRHGFHFSVERRNRLYGPDEQAIPISTAPRQAPSRSPRSDRGSASSTLPPRVKALPISIRTKPCRNATSVRDSGRMRASAMLAAFSSSNSGCAENRQAARISGSLKALPL